MEIAHAQTKVLRVIVKLVLLGLLVVLLVKVILPLLLLAVVGLSACVVARALYNRRSSLKQMLFWTKERLVHCVATVSQSGTVAKTAAGRASWMLLRLIETLYAILVVAWALLGPAANFARVVIWKSVQKAQRVVISALVITFRLGKTIATALLQVPVRGSVILVRTAAGAVAWTRSQSSVIFGTFVEGASGAILGAMLAFILGSLSHAHAMEARVCGAALFGAFLGIMVGLSRTTWPKQGEQGHLLENQN